MAGKRGRYGHHSWGRRGRFESLECRRLLNAAPVGEPDYFERRLFGRNDFVETALRTYAIEAPGVLANDQDPDSDPLQAILLSVDDGLSLRLQPDGGFEFYVIGEGLRFNFSYVVSDGVQTSPPVTVELFGLNAKNEPNVKVWSVEASGNGHGYLYYWLQTEDDTIEHLLDATSQVRYLDSTAHLATLTSAEENEFVFNRFHDGVFGAYQDTSAEDYQEPNGGWRWVTGEPWEYTNWFYTEPNDHFGFGTENIAQLFHGGQWNDIPISSSYLLLEFEDLGAFPGDDSFLLPLGTESLLPADDLLENDILGRPGFSLEIVKAPAQGTVEIDESGNVLYLPGLEAPYRDRFTYRLVLDGYASAPATVWLNVGGDNWPTVTEEDRYYVTAESILEVDGYNWPTVLANDLDRDGIPVTARLERAPEGGVIELQPDGRFRFMPNEGFRGFTTFSYSATDGLSRSEPTEVEIDYYDFRTEHFARPDKYTYSPGHILSVPTSSGLLSNDLSFGEHDYRILPQTILTSAGGHAHIHRDGSFDYVPPPNFVGPDHFSYSATGTHPLARSSWMTTATDVDLTMDGTVLDPVATADTYVLDHSGTVTTEASTGVTANDFGFQTGWSVRLVEGPQQGVLRLATDGAFTYHAFETDPLAAVEDRFTYQFYDGERSLKPVEVQLTRDALPEVIRVAWPDAPGDPDREYLILVPNIDFSQTGLTWFLADSLGNSLTSGGRRGHLLTITSPEEQAFVEEMLFPRIPEGSEIWLGARQYYFNAQSPEEWSWVTGEAFDFTKWRAAPEKGSRFNDFVELHVQGIPVGTWETRHYHGGFDVRPLIIEFSQFSEPVRPAAEASDDAYFMQNGSTSIVVEEGLLVNDNVPSGNVTVQLVEGPATGSLQWAEDGSFSYASADSAAADSFTYQLVDGDWRSESATVWLNVNPQQASLVAEPDTYQVVEDIPLHVDAREGVLANDLVNASARVSAFVEVPPEVGSLDLNADGSFLYTPPLDFHGRVTFAYRAVHGENESVGHVELEIRAEPDAPRAVEDRYQFGDGATLFVDATRGVLANDVDADGLGMLAQIVTEPLFGSLDFSQDGSFTYTPNGDFRYSDQFAYQVVGLDGRLSSPQTVLIATDGGDAVTPAFGETFLHGGVDVLSGNVLENEQALATALTAALVQAPAHGRINFHAIGEFEYLADPDFEGLDEFVYAVLQDGQALGFARTQIHVQHVSGTFDLTGLRVLADPESERGMAYALVSNEFGTDDEITSWNRSETISKQLAYQGVQGRLATPTSAEEWNWMTRNVGSTGWLGAKQNFESPDYVEPDGGWEWVSGEPWDFAPWAEAEPDDKWGESRLLSINGKWADRDRFPAGFFVEFPGQFVPALTSSDDVYHVEPGQTLEVDPGNGIIINDEYFPKLSRLELLEDASHGELELDAIGGIRYTPAPDFVGVDHFTYRAGSEDAITNVATVWLLVGARVPPQARPDTYYLLGDQLYAAEADDALVTDFADGFIPNWLQRRGDFRLEGNILQGDNVDFTSLRFDNYWANQDSYLWEAEFVLLPLPPNYSGSDSITFGITDPETVIRSFTSIEEPYFVLQRTRRAENFPNDGFADALRLWLRPEGSDSPPDLHILPLVGLSSSEVTVSVRFWKVGNSATIEFDVNSQGEFQADATYYLADLGQGAAENSTPLQPFITGSFELTGLDQLGYIPLGTRGVTTNDTVVGEAPRAIMIDPPQHGTLDFRDDGTFDYAPQPDFRGQDTFVYVDESGGFRSRPVTVTLNVVPPLDDFRVRDDQVQRRAGSTIVEAQPLLTNHVGEAVYDPSRGILWFTQLRNSFLSPYEQNCFSTGVSCHEGGLYAWDINANRAVAYVPNANGHEYFNLELSADYALLRFETIRHGFVANVEKILQRDWQTDAINFSVGLPSEYAEKAEQNYEMVVWHPSNQFGFGRQRYRNQTYLITIQGDELHEQLLELPDHLGVWWESEWQRLDFWGDLVSPDGQHWWSFNKHTNSLEYHTQFSRPFFGLTDGGLYLPRNRESTYVYGKNGEAIDIRNEQGELVATVEVSGVETENWWGIVELVDRTGELLLITDRGLFLLDFSDVFQSRIDLFANDDVANLRNQELVIVEPPQHGDVTVTNEGKAIYFPEPSFQGEDTFRYRVVGAGWESNVATVSLNIEPALPRSASLPRTDSYTTYGNFTANSEFGVLYNDTLAEGAVAVVSSPPNHGTVELADDGGFTYVPAPGYTGEDVFHYYIQDEASRTETVAVFLDVRASFETAIVFVEEPTTKLQLDSLPSATETVAVGDNVITELWVRYVEGYPATRVPIRLYEAPRQSIEFDTTRLSVTALSELGWFFDINVESQPRIDNAAGSVGSFLVWPVTLDVDVRSSWVRLAFATFETTSMGVATASPTVEFPLSVDPSFADRLNLPTSTLRVTSPADFNRDGAVDLTDFSTLKSSFGQSGTAASGDANRDGKVDLLDFVLMKHDFGFRID